MTDYPGTSEAEASFDRLAEMYDDLRRYDLAAQSLAELARRFPNNARDAAWRAGELFEKRVKDPQRARESYGSGATAFIALPGCAEEASTVDTVRPDTP